MQKKIPGQSVIIGVMGGADASEEDKNIAYQVGKLIAENGWILLNGGRNCGIMDASAQGAFENGGLTIGILPGINTVDLSQYIHIPIITGMGNARNSINVMSSHIVVALKGGAGTVSEIALALKHKKKVILLGMPIIPLFDTYRQNGYLIDAKTPREVIDLIHRLL